MSDDSIAQFPWDLSKMWNQMSGLQHATSHYARGQTLKVFLPSEMLVRVTACL